MKRIIFHIPNKINSNLASGSQIRPMKMLKAFTNIGYEVDIIMGYVNERKKQIKKIKENIKNGIKYDFLYSESSTMPTALTEAHHLPIAPFLDFKFFKFCRENNIKIGLFYRDVYWIFDIYKAQTKFIKRKIAIFFYKFDLKQYNKYLNVLFLPSAKMIEFVPINFKNEVIPLPPAIENKQLNFKKDNTLRLIYVGGIGGVYDLKMLVSNVNTSQNTKLNLCVRESDWNINSKAYKNKKNIEVFHKTSKELAEIYNISDVAIYFIKPDKLWTFAVGVKLFEYIAYKKPIIAVKNTAVGDFIETNNIGWVIEYDENMLDKLITKIQNNPELIQEKITNIEKIIHKNTWEARAKQVRKELVREKV